ncbi:hypothetical protein EAE96_002835 [Botrytis aclada]|nr:hypothetical protein EAE96_002835 [Botrytis aclada]
MAGRRFTLFPKLPVEMQDRIWKFTIQPRIVEVRTKKDKHDGFYSTAPLPIALSVCKDSKRAISYLYPKYFGGVVVDAGIRFNAKIDTLYLDWKLQEDLVTFLPSITVQEAEKVKFLALDQFIRWARCAIELNYDFSRTTSHAVTVFDLQTNFYREYCHVAVNHNFCRIESEDLEPLCSAVRLMSNLEELIFVHDDILWDELLLEEGGILPPQDELAGLTLFQPEEVYDLFPDPVNPGSDYRTSIEYYNEDMPIVNLHDELITKFDSPKFTILVRYGWRFPDSLTPSARRYPSLLIEDNSRTS